MKNELANFFGNLFDYDNNLNNNEPEFNDNFFNHDSMNTNLIDKGKSYQLVSQLPGFKKQNININYQNGNLSIKASHDVNKSDKNKKGQVIHSEFSYNNVGRDFYLPNVDMSKASAKYDGGMLKINLPKKSTTNNHTINIK